MSNYRISDRYAKSLLSLAKTQNVLESAKNDMLLISNSLKGSSELRVLLQSPIVPSDKKISILEGVFGMHISQLSKAYLQIIVKKRREAFLNEIALSFINLYNKEMGIAIAKLSCAHPLDANMEQKILAIVKQETQKDVQMHVQINPMLIGGFVLTVGDKQIDASIKRQLQNLRKQFSDNPFIQKF